MKYLGVTKVSIAKPNSSVRTKMLVFSADGRKICWQGSSDIVL